MRLLYNHLITVYYSDLSDTERIIDDSGYYTGEVEKIYSEPTEIHCSVSSATGMAEVNTFGTLTDYNYVLLIAGSCPFSENAMLWIDKTPAEGECNAVVRRIAKTKNYCKIAIKKVDVNEATI